MVSSWTNLRIQLAGPAGGRDMGRGIAEEACLTSQPQQPRGGVVFTEMRKKDENRFGLKRQGGIKHSLLDTLGLRVLVGIRWTCHLGSWIHQSGWIFVGRSEMGLYIWESSAHRRSLKTQGWIRQIIGEGG